jgi:hypothetical protein
MARFCKHHTSSLNLALAQAENSDAAFAAPKLTQIDDGELGLSMFEGGPRR